ncbi:MAG: class I tRNA ligase family protein, partial [Bacteroidota bacterium]
WYFLRYMDPKNEHEFAANSKIDYWQQIDLYLGGSEHATGHLLYFRFWTKFLYDLGLIPFDEPAKKLINQGMITGVSEKIFKKNGVSWNEENNNSILTISTFNKTINFHKHIRHVYVSYDILKNIDDREFENEYQSDANVPIEFTENSKLNILDYYNCSQMSENKDCAFVTTEGYWCEGNWYTLFGDISAFGLTNCNFFTKPEVEKMSKSKYNVVTPDLIIEEYGADTLRLYEMFLGPLEQSKPWSTQGIEGVHRFLKKLWKLFYNSEGNLIITDEEPNKKELKSIHKLIKKVGEDVEGFSFNTSVSSFMICVNELTDLKCNKKKILSDYLICLSPYAPHIAEELWNALGNNSSIVTAKFPEFKPEFLIEDSFSYPISINGKHRTNIEMGMEMQQSEVEQLVMSDEIVLKWLEGKQPKKIVFVKGRIVNVVV